MAVVAAGIAARYRTPTAPSAVEKKAQELSPNPELCPYAPQVKVSPWRCAKASILTTMRYHLSGDRRAVRITQR
jgi:hypothetical protein